MKRPKPPAVPDPGPPPTPRRRRHAPLTSIDHCRREVERIYRAVQDGLLIEEKATKRAFLVSTISRMIETGDLAQRLDALEIAMDHDA
jgi:hypothetical protein